MTPTQNDSNGTDQPVQTQQRIDFAHEREPSTADHSASFGDRLRAAREARNFSLAHCAQSLKLPLRVLRQLETGDEAGLDSKIYLGSYISNYARFLGINQASIQVELDRIKQEEPTLVATGGISHSRFLFDRYATAATYVVLTAVLVVPMIWLGVRGTLDRNITHLAPLDAAPVAQQDTAAPAVSGSAAYTAQRLQSSSVALAPPPVVEQPLMASMAPFPSLDTDVVELPKVAPAPIQTGSGAHSLSLTLSAASWVDVTAADGTRLEYGLMPAGTSKTFHSDQSLDVRIGNAQGANVSIDGQPVALDGFRHANVARFGVQMRDGKAAAVNL